MTHTFDLQIFADGGESAGALADASPDGSAAAYGSPLQGELCEAVRGRDLQTEKPLDPTVICGDTSLCEGEAQLRSVPAGDTAIPHSSLLTPHSNASHLDRLLSEAEELKRTVPDFDLWRELENSDFARLTNPTSRVSVRAAYYAVHHDEINTRNMRAAAEAAAAETAKRLTGAYLSAQRRPQENGCASSSASLETVDWRTASREQLIAQRRAILAAAARGEKIYPKYK